MAVATAGRTSRASAAIVYLAAALRDRPQLTGVQVLEEPAMPEDLGVEYIVVATDVLTTQEFASLGAVARDEQVVITGVLSTKTLGGINVAQITRERAWLLLGEIEQVVIGGATLGTRATLGSNGYNAHVARAHYRPAVDDGGRYGTIEFDVAFWTRLNWS